MEKTISETEHVLRQGIRKFEYATPAFIEVYQLGAALDYLQAVGVDRIEQHTVGLAHRMHRGLTDEGFRVWTPANNRSATVAFEHGVAYEKAQKALDAAGIQVSFREENTQIRVGAALFNTAEEVDRFLQVMGSVR